jgi:hypothetical protein
MFFLLTRGLNCVIQIRVQATPASGHHNKLGFLMEQSVTTGVATINHREHTMNTQIQTHRSYDADDYDYLVAKGWTDAEILARWDQEATAGKGPCRWNTLIAQQKLRTVIQRN